MRDPYAVLGVSQTATDEEITQAYKRLARQYHPDLNPGDKHAEAMMKELNSAYDEIKDIRSGKKSGYRAGYGYGNQSTGTEGQGEYYSWQSPFSYTFYTNWNAGQRRQTGRGFSIFKAVIWFFIIQAVISLLLRGCMFFGRRFTYDFGAYDEQNSYRNSEFDAIEKGTAGIEFVPNYDIL